MAFHLRHRSDRRQHERVHAELPLVAWSLATPTKLHRGSTVDLSSGGALLHVPGMPAMAATLDVCIELPDRRLSTTVVVVRHDADDHAAVAWPALSREDGERLSRGSSGS